MKKIIVVGRSGTGKSTFSMKLREITNINVYHLDNIFWRADKSQVSRDEIDEKLKEILNKKEWIIDGDYSRTYEERFQSCDTIFFFDLPLSDSLQGIESRIGKKREDLPWTEEEFDEEFKEYIINWDEETAPKLRNLIAKYKDKKNIIVFSSRKESEDYLISLENKIANKRITSTIVIGIFLLISILFVIWLIPFNLKERYSAYVESVQNSPKVDGEMILILNLFAGIGALGLLCGAYIPALLSLINSAVSLIFSIKNRKSSIKCIRIINYIYDVLLIGFIIYAIIKIILFRTGIA